MGGSAAQLLDRALREEDAARRRGALDPGREIDAFTEDVVAGDDHFAEIDSDAEAHPPVGQRLESGGAVERRGAAGEFGEDAVARGLDDAPAARLDFAP